MADPLNMLVLNASLKHEGSTSNTEEVTQLVLDEMAKATTRNLVQTASALRTSPLTS